MGIPPSQQTPAPTNAHSLSIFRVNVYWANLNVCIGVKQKYILHDFSSWQSPQSHFLSHTLDSGTHIPSNTQKNSFSLQAAAKNKNKIGYSQKITFSLFNRISDFDSITRQCSVNKGLNARVDNSLLTLYTRFVFRFLMKRATTQRGFFSLRIIYTTDVVNGTHVTATAIIDETRMTLWSKRI